jgi:hypothetical protein
MKSLFCFPTSPFKLLQSLSFEWKAFLLFSHISLKLRQ